MYNPVFYDKTVVWENSESSGEYDIYGSTIPEPATLLLFGLGAVMLRRKH
jgi:hypothetical protein